jgi:hypothetical protein
MRRGILLFLPVLILALASGGCRKQSTPMDSIPLGTEVTVQTSDGSIVKGRLVRVSPDTVVVDLANGGSANVPRAQVSAVTVEEGAPAASGAPATTGSQPPAGEKAAPPPAHGLEEAAPGETRPAFHEVIVPAGTILPLQLEDTIGSDTAKVEQPVHARVSRAVLVDERTAIPAGSTVQGVVTEARQAGRVRGRAQLGLRFDTLMLAGTTEHYAIRTTAAARTAPSTKKKDAMEIGGGAAGGALIGAIIGGKKGAVIGTAVGGGTGTGVVLSTRGKEVRLPKGAELSVKLLEPITVRLPIGG